MFGGAGFQETRRERGGREGRREGEGERDVG